MTADTITITLAGAPMGKERVRMTPTGPRLHAGADGGALEPAGPGGPAGDGRAGVLDGPLEVSVEAHMPVAESEPKKWRAAALAGEIRPVKKPDWDNFGKILDALGSSWSGSMTARSSRPGRKFYSDGRAWRSMFGPFNLNRQAEFSDERRDVHGLLGQDRRPPDGGSRAGRTARQAEQNHGGLIA